MPVSTLPESIEISSMISTCIPVSRSRVCLFLAIFSRSSMVMRSRMPIPDQEWIVCPPICVAAMPVEAVTATGTFLSLKYSIYWLIRYVLPVPADPVRYALCPDLSIESAVSCSKTNAFYDLRKISWFWMEWREMWYTSFVDVGFRGQELFLWSIFKFCDFISCNSYTKVNMRTCLLWCRASVSHSDLSILKKLGYNHFGQSIIFYF